MHHPDCCVWVPSTAAAPKTTYSNLSDPSCLGSARRWFLQTDSAVHKRFGHKPLLPCLPPVHLLRMPVLYRNPLFIQDHLYILEYRTNGKKSDVILIIVMKYYIHTFGCQMNESDSERFSTVVESIGY